MKKIIATAAILTVLGTATAMAAPVNKLAANETAIGAGTKESYIEHKMNSNLTIGYQYADRDEYSGQNDIYAQYDLVGKNLKAVAGWRNNLPGSTSNIYGGLAVVSPSVMGFEAYASYVKGSDFGEAQVGINKNIIANVDLNLNYHNFAPDNGHHETGVGAGISVKF